MTPGWILKNLENLILNMKNLIALFLSLFLFASCDNIEPELVVCPDPESTNVLMLVSDYTTNTFEGGKAFQFEDSPKEFTLKTEYKEPGDFGYIKLYYSEINQLLFHGEIIWMGSGKILFPEKLTPAKDFEFVTTKDLVSPKNGFECIHRAIDQTVEMGQVWKSVQGLVKARAYLSANPEQKVKYFLYTPSVGVGNPEEWKWVFFLKK